VEGEAIRNASLGIFVLARSEEEKENDNVKCKKRKHAFSQQQILQYRQMNPTNHC
jgi:hypothetical protein